MSISSRKADMGSRRPKCGNFIFRRTSAVVGLLAAAVVIAPTFASAASTVRDQPKKAAKSYNVIVISDLTGVSASTSSPYDDGVMTAFDLQNSEHGVDGHKILYTTLDTQSTPTGSQAAFRQAIGSSPLVIMSATGSTTFNAAEPLLTAGGSVVIGANALGFPLMQWLFAPVLTGPQTNITAEAAIKAASGGHLTGVKVAIVDILTANTQAQAPLIQLYVQQQGGSVVSTQFTAAGLSSFATQAAQIVSSGVQIVQISDTLPDALVETAALKVAGYTGKFVLAQNLSDDGTLTQMGLNNVYAERPYNYASQGSQIYKWAVKFHHASNATLEPFARGFLMGQMLIAGLKKCPNTYCSSTPSLIKSMNKIRDFTVPGNMLTFGPGVITPTRHNPLTEMGLFKWNPVTHRASLATKVALGLPSYPPAS